MFEVGDLVRVRVRVDDNDLVWMPGEIGVVLGADQLEQDRYPYRVTMLVDHNKNGWFTPDELELVEEEVKDDKPS